jgi:hypothetical protein
MGALSALTTLLATLFTVPVFSQLDDSQVNEDMVNKMVEHLDEMIGRGEKALELGEEMNATDLQLADGLRKMKHMMEGGVPSPFSAPIVIERITKALRVFESFGYQMRDPTQQDTFEACLRMTTISNGGSDMLQQKEVLELADGLGKDDADGSFYYQLAACLDEFKSTDYAQWAKDGRKAPLTPSMIERAAKEGKAVLQAMDGEKWDSLTFYVAEYVEEGQPPEDEEAKRLREGAEAYRKYKEMKAAEDAAGGATEEL